jgi:hypothetical protein
MGCEATKAPAAGDVFFLDFYLYRTYQELVIVPNLNQAALIARTSEACSSTGIMGSSPLVLTGSALM